MEPSVHDDPDLLAITAEEQAYRHLLRGIRLGRYKAGDRLVPEDIAAEIGMSRMPVREAFRRLAAQDLLTLRPNRGALVRGLNPAEVEEVFEMRAVLEGLAAATALPAIGPAELTALDQRLDAMDQASLDVSEWVTAHRDFHLALCLPCRRPRLMGQVSALHSTIEPHMRLWLEHADKPLSSRDEHAQLLAVLRRGNAEALEAAMREHIRSTIPTLHTLMRSARTA